MNFPSFPLTKRQKYARALEVTTLVEAEDHLTACAIHTSCLETITPQDAVNWNKTAIANYAVYMCTHTTPTDMDTLVRIAKLYGIRNEINFELAPFKLSLS